LQSVEPADQYDHRECYSIGRSGDWCDCRDPGLYALSMRKGSSGPDTCT